MHRVSFYVGLCGGQQNVKLVLVITFNLVFCCAYYVMWWVFMFWGGSYVAQGPSFPAARKYVCLIGSRILVQNTQL